jgi:magnesium transporter
MIYISDLVGKPVIDVDGERVGRVQDVIASVHEHFPHPQIIAIAVHQLGNDVRIISMAAVTVLLAPVVVLAHKRDDLTPFEVTDGLWLARDVLDREIIDTDAARVVRVNGLELAHVGGSYYVANVAIGGLALLRRLGLARFAQLLASVMGRTLTTATISWEHVELLPGVHPLRMRFAGGKAADLPAADVAEIISNLNRVESSRVVESMDVERLADTLEEVEPDFQASLVQSLPDEKVADLLDEMAPDEAADLLAELPEERSEDLLNLMQHEEAEDVRKLLAYPEDAAGGIMTTDFVTVRPNVTVEQAIATLRETAREDETIYYVYVTDEENHLLGVFSLQKLILARAETPVTEIMHDRIVSFRPLDSQDDVAQAVAKYNLLAVPVVDDENRMQGIITADDAIDKMIPTAWKKRLPRLY